MWQLILSLLQGMGQQNDPNGQAQGGSGLSGMIGGMLGRKTDDRGSFLNTIDPGGGMIDKKTMEKRGLSKKDAVLSNLTGGLFGGGNGDPEPEPTLEEQLDRMMNWQREQKEWQDYQGAVDEMGDDPNYGAIQPDWGEIWDNYSNKISQNYWGSATSPGVAGKIKASSARRNVQDSPAQDELMLRMGAEEGGQLKDLGVQQGIQKTNLTSAAKKDYTNRLAGLAGQAQINNFASLLPTFMDDALPEAPDYSWMEGVGGSISDLLDKKKKVPGAVGAGSMPKTYGSAQGTTAWTSPAGQRFGPY